MLEFSIQNMGELCCLIVEKAIGKISILYFRIHCFNDLIEGSCMDLEFTFFMKCSGEAEEMPIRLGRMAECEVDHEEHDYSDIDSGVNADVPDLNSDPDQG